MRVLSGEELNKWFRAFDNLENPDDYVHADDDGLYFTNREAACIELEYPAKLEQLPFFSHCLATIGYEDQHFDGAVIWVQSWGVWNLFNEGIGYRIVEKMNAGAGQPRSFEASPGHQFRADELAEAIGMLLQPMIFAWDSYYLPIWAYGTGQFFLHISHDSFVTIVTRTKEFHDKVFQQLQELKLNPKVSNESRTRRFCHKV
jgi:hypothetical protein